MMNTSDAARARSRAYDLFGRFYREGLTPSLQAEAEDVPALADALDAAYDPDEAAADHYRLFGLNVFPYAGVFLDASGHLGSPVAAHARRMLHQAGIPLPPTTDGADHLAYALDALAFLTAAEADAWTGGLPDEADRVRTVQRRLFDAYLLWWLPAFVNALRRQNHRFYTALADVTLELAFDHRAALGPPLHAADAPPLPDPPDLLDDERTGLKHIAACLTTHAWSGLLLSRDDIARLGRTEHLPRGFGSRAQTLANLLSAAATYDRLDPLLRRLTDQVLAVQAFYQTLPEHDVPLLDRVAQAWQKRLTTTETLLAEISRILAHAE